MPRRIFDPAAPYQPLSGACRLTGLSVHYLREGCKRGTVPHIRCGNEYRANVPLLLRQLEAQSAANAGDCHEA